MPRGRHRSLALPPWRLRCLFTLAPARRRIGYFMTEPQSATPNEESRPLRLPVLPLYETVVFPRMMQPIQVGRRPSLLAVDEAIKRRPHRIVLLTQTDSGKQDVGPED